MAAGKIITDYIQYGSGAPSGSPSLYSPSEFGIYQDITTGNIYAWNLFTSAWVQIATGSVTPSDATTSAVGVVKIRTAASGPHPIALTTDDLGANSGVAELDSGGHVPLAELAGITANKLSLTENNTYLGANVTMTSANTFYDGPTTSITGNLFLVFGVLTVKPASTTAIVTCRLWDGSTTWAETQATASSSTAYINFFLAGLVSPSGSPSIYRLSAASSATGGTIEAAVTNNSSGTHACSIYSLQVG